MIKRIYYTAILFILVLAACVPSQQKRNNSGDSFRSVPVELGEPNWNKTPADVVSDPIKDEPLIWVGVVKDVALSQKEDKIEIEWLCEHLKFIEAGPKAILSRPIKASKGKGYFAVSLIVGDMTMEQAAKFKKEHTSTPHYMLAGGKFNGLVERQGMRVPFLFTYRFGLGPDLAVIEK